MILSGELKAVVPACQPRLEQGRRPTEGPERERSCGKRVYPALHRNFNNDAAVQLQGAPES